MHRRKAPGPRHIWSGDFLSAQVLLAAVKAAAPMARGRLLDLGCGKRPYASLFRSIDFYVGYDSDPIGSSPDVCGLATVLPFRDAAFDAVFSTQVLEHVSSPLTMLREVWRVLAPGGLLLLSAPQYWRLHEEPDDYFRYTRYGLEALLTAAGFNAVTITPQGGAWRLAGQAINNTIYQRFGSTILTHVAFSVFNVIAICLDRIWYDEGDTMNYMVRAVKPT